MVVNALDEILFWEDFFAFRARIRILSAKYYPHDPESYFREKGEAFQESIPTREEFLRRLAYYEKHGSPLWTSGRNAAIDDLSATDMEKAFLNCTAEQGAERAASMEKTLSANRPRFEHYAEAILHRDRNTVLELTVGAGLGSGAVMRKMKECDSYFGVDIDFRCAKNADGLAKHYGVRGLGMAASLWNLPFDDGVFSSVCCHCGLNECREVPTILREAVRVLAPSGRIVLSCLNLDRVSMGLPCFLSYGFSEEEATALMERVRMYAGFASVDRILTALGCIRVDSRPWENGAGRTLVYEKA